VKRFRRPIADEVEFSSLDVLAQCAEMNFNIAIKSSSDTSSACAGKAPPGVSQTP
jgi:hypothetical protein